MRRTFGGCIGFYSRVQRGGDEARRPADGRHMGMRLPGSVPARRPAARRRRRQAAHGISRREGPGGAAGQLRPIPVDWYEVADWERLKLGPWMGGATAMKLARRGARNGKGFRCARARGLPASTRRWRCCSATATSAATTTCGTSRRACFSRHACGGARGSSSTASRSRDDGRRDGTAPSQPRLGDRRGATHCPRRAPRTGLRGGGHHINLVDDVRAAARGARALEGGRASANGARRSSRARVEATLRDVAAHDLLRSRPRDDGRRVRIVCVVASRYVTGAPETVP